MTEEHYKEWLENPVTIQFRKYLLESANSEIEIAAEGMKNGAVLSETEQVRANTVYLTLERIAEIDFEEISSFYEEK